MKKIIITIIVFFTLISVSSAELFDESDQLNIEVQKDDDESKYRKNPDLNQIQYTFNKSKIDSNIKIFKYNRTHTYKINLREYMQCLIVLPENERIQDFALGDSAIFQFTPLIRKKGDKPKNIFQLSVNQYGCDTNLTVIGLSGNIYSFYLRANGVKNNVDPDMVVYIENKDPLPVLTGNSDKTCKECEADNPPSLQSNKKDDYIRELTKINPSDINISYTTSKGNQDLKPLKIFDDGYFTYFQYGKKNLDKVENLPVIYKVVGGYDSPVNSRIERGFIIAESISEKWTLRSGEEYLCVRKTK